MSQFYTKDQTDELAGFIGRNVRDSVSALEVVDLNLLNKINNIPIIPGPQGTPGIDGKDGISAYEVAVTNGYRGTKTEWLNYIKADGGIQAIQDFLTKPSDKRVAIPDYGNIPSLQGYIKEMFENGGLPATPFSTYTEMTASALVDGDYAFVINDADLGRNGVYRKSKGIFVYAKYNNFGLLDSIRINNGKEMPLAYFDRGGSRAAQHIYLRNALGAARVDNARPGHYYRLAYVQNGAVFDKVEKNYGVIVERVNSKTGYTARVINYIENDNQIEFDRLLGGIQTFTLRSSVDPVTTFTFTFDVDALPPDGTLITAVSKEGFGYNSIISPLFYSYLPEVSYAADDLLINYESDDSLSVCYLSNDKWYRLDFKRKSENLTLQNFGFGYADAYSYFGDLIPPEYADFITRTEAGSDFHSPLVFRAVNNGMVGTNKRIYTSGAHSKDGNDAGGATARSLNITLYADDVRLKRFTTGRLKAKRLKIVVTNLVMAYNTIDSDRYALEQNYVYDISVAGQFVECNYRALEDVVIETDNGLQAYIAGLTPIVSNTLLLVGGNKGERGVFNDQVFDAGTKTTSPNAYGVVIRHPAAGEFSTWVDNGYGVGNRQYLANDKGQFEHPRVGSSKIYARLIGGIELQLNKGDSYQWRGGFYWGQSTETGYHDAVLQTQNGMLLVNKDSSYTIV